MISVLARKIDANIAMDLYCFLSACASIVNSAACASELFARFRGGMVISVVGECERKWEPVIALPAIYCVVFRTATRIL